MAGRAGAERLLAAPRVGHPPAAIELVLGVAAIAAASQCQATVVEG